MHRVQIRRTELAIRVPRCTRVNFVPNVPVDERYRTFCGTSAEQWSESDTPYLGIVSGRIVGRRWVCAGFGIVGGNSRGGCPALGFRPVRFVVNGTPMRPIEADDGLRER